MIKPLLKRIRLILWQIQAWLYAKNRPIPPKKYEVGDIFVFIRSWNRPLYLWTCLDNLYRNTSKNIKFVLIDNASTNPLVKEVIKGFERRGLFYAVHYMERNHGTNQQVVFKRYRKEIGKYFFLLDADITIQSKFSWIDTLIDQAEKQPNLSIIGSYIDISDFVSYKKAETIEPDLTEHQITHLIKGRSPERSIPPKTSDIITPFIPPGRLLLVRTDVIDKVGLPIGNTNLCRAVKDAGFGYGISTKVEHRHLSLLNIYDYPSYDFEQLNKYLTGQ